jgi:hypothetical protein
MCGGAAVSRLPVWSAGTPCYWHGCPEREGGRDGTAFTADGRRVYLCGEHWRDYLALPSAEADALRAAWALPASER